MSQWWWLDWLVAIGYSMHVRAAEVLDTLTDCKAELEHVDSPFLLQEVHKTEEKVLLLSDFLQLQLQHLVRENSGDKICP